MGHHPLPISHPQYTAIKKRSIVIDGQRTSISLEDRFWHSLRAIAYAERVNTSTLVSQINTKRGDIGLSSAVRQFVFCHLLERSPLGKVADQVADHAAHPAADDPDNS
jgi:predicted DNA-binding ribbon-helix-helix protein